MPPSSLADARANAVLAAVPDAVLRRFLADLAPTTLHSRQLLYEAGEPIREVYFPLTAVVSLLTLLHDGGAVEAAMLGNDSMAGLPLALGLESDVNQVINQVPGDALRMSAEAFRAALAEADGALRAAAHRAILAVILQMGQTAACNRRHPVEERCARWLLQCRDRVGADHFEITQEHLASMLGVRRPSVTVAAGMLSRAGLIRYQRGRITIVDRAGLEASTCECYRAIIGATARLLPTNAALGGGDRSPERRSVR